MRVYAPLKKTTAAFTGYRRQTNLNYTTMTAIKPGVCRDAFGSVPERACKRHKPHPRLLP